MSRLVWLLLVTLLLNGCSTFGKEKDPTLNWSQKKLFDEAASSLQQDDFKQAIDYYEKLEARYPFGPYAHQAQLNIAYAYYRADEPESALAAADRFIKFHPQNPAVAYAHYLRGLVNFNRSLGFLSRFLPIDTSQRDPGSALNSYRDFEIVVKDYPHSIYAEDARKRMLYLRNNLARHEIDVADFYMKRGAFVAAADRANYVVENYERTPAVKEALEIMIKAYTKLHMPKLAADARRVLAYNEHNGSLIPDPMNEPPKGWLARLWRFLGLDRN